MGDIRELPKMRTIIEAVQELKKQDDKTAVTVYALRRMVKTGELPCIYAGKKCLINMRVLEDVLNNKYGVPMRNTLGSIRKQ